jgi:type IV pilus assembly PilW-like protein
VNLKAQYGVDSNCNGVLTWETATGPWSAANVAALPLPATPPFCVAGVPSLRQIQAVRIAIVTRSAQYEKDPVTMGPLKMFDDTVSMSLTTDETHYRYKVLETVVPLRNALWNPS